MDDMFAELVQHVQYETCGMEPPAEVFQSAGGWNTEPAEAIRQLEEYFERSMANAKK
jgi:hypothetical protein